MNDLGPGPEAGADRTSDPDADELFHRLTEMLAPQLNPPAMVKELARQSFGLRTVDAELAALIADSEVEGTAAAVRGPGMVDVPRLLTFETPGLIIELEISGSGRQHRILGELVPPGPATVLVRQPSAPGGRAIETDDEGRFVIEDLRPGPFSLTCRRDGHSAVTTEWTSLD
jgi:hypothetical protein